MLDVHFNGHIINHRLKSKIFTLIFESNMQICQHIMLSYWCVFVCFVFFLAFCGQCITYNIYCALMSPIIMSFPHMGVLHCEPPQIIAYCLDCCVPRVKHRVESLMVWLSITWHFSSSTTCASEPSARTMCIHFFKHGVLCFRMMQSGLINMKVISHGLHGH